MWKSNNVCNHEGKFRSESPLLHIYIYIYIERERERERERESDVSKMAE